MYTVIFCCIASRIGSNRWYCRFHWFVPLSSAVSIPDAKTPSSPRLEITPHPEAAIRRTIPVVYEEAAITFGRTLPPSPGPT